MTKFMIVDATNICFRAACVAFASQNLLEKQNLQQNQYLINGIPTATFQVFFNLFNHIMMKIQPTHIVCCFDTNTNTFRKKIYPEYKAQRQKNLIEGMDIAIIQKQFKFIRKMLDILGIKNINIESYEADDLCGSCLNISQADENYIISGDKDSWQLINDNTVVIFPKNGFTDYIIVDKNYIEDKYDIPYNRYIDLKILQGDKSDNISAYKGVGPKIAAKMINEFKNSDQITKLKIEDLNNYNKTIKNNLYDWQNKYELLKILMTIKTDINLPYTYTDFEINLLKWLDLKPWLEELHMYNLINRISYGAVYRLRW